MRHLRHVPLVVALLGVTAVAWVLLSRRSDRADWLRLEAPVEVVSGGRMPLLVVLKDPQPGLMLDVDLHWKDARRESRGMLSGSRAQPVAAGQSEYSFDLPVPARPGLAYVYVVIVLSPTGLWRDRTQVCLTEPIAVRASSDPARSGRFHTVVPHEQRLSPPPPRVDSPAVRWASVLLWLGAGALCWRVRSAHPGAAATAPAVALLARRWTWLTLACLLAAFWEASAVEAHLGELLRRLAVARGWYEGRRHLQEFASALVLGVSLVCAGLALRRDHAQPVALVFTSTDVYWGISAISFISLHDADAWLATPVLAIPLVQLVKLAAALVALGGAAQATTRKSHPPGPAPGSGPPASASPG